jgi:hypothetical protein
MCFDRQNNFILVAMIQTILLDRAVLYKIEEMSIML